MFKRITSAAFLAILMLAAVLLSSCDDAKFHHSLYVYPAFNNRPVITEVKHDGAIDWYTVKTHGTIYTFETSLADSAGKYKVGDTLCVSKYSR